MPLEDFQQGCFDISKQVAPQKEIAVCRDWTREVVIVFWVSFCESFSKWIFVLTLNIHVIDIFVDWFVKKKLKENSFFFTKRLLYKTNCAFPSHDKDNGRGSNERVWTQQEFHVLFRTVWGL